MDFIQRLLMFLRNMWYFAMPSNRLKAGGLEAKVILGEPVMFGRTESGTPFALCNICPHRGMPLTHGRLDRNEVECCYHGWRFDQEGQCTVIPSLAGSQNFNLDQISVRSYVCYENQGNIWIFMGQRQHADNLPLPPQIPELLERQPSVIHTMSFPAHVDHVVIGLMDPAHGPFVHQAWWWRRQHSIHEKAKRFVPSNLGFTMVRHPPSINSAAYRILGDDITTEISFQLPGTRIEHIRAGSHTICGLTTVTPIDETHSEVNHMIYWTIPWLTLFKPLVRYFASAFLNQDRKIMIKQQQGLKFEPALSLIDGADTQAKWYYRLKREWFKAEGEGRLFKNPLQETVLRWRS